ncbi:IS3 family transposase [Flavobacterium sp.]|uniref:IS3 family transposase n=1 Tax=Flavobacterium sp. TaxID=239 RepID=UPI001B3ED236|nr:IS3 family transposase [Flavobacterium sp.]MBP6182784.1 IS3 family transposase [Flavobacterium sp.]
MNRSEPSPEKRSQRDYNLGFKLAVISQVEKGELTYKQAQKKYGIQGRSTVLVWLRKFGTLDWSKPNLLFMSKTKETPAQVIKRLEKELADEKLKNTVLTTMIDISDSQYGTQIRKKFFSQTIRRIQQEQGISMSRTCRLFGISRQAIYQQEARCLEREKELLIVKQLVEKQRRLMPRLGARKLYFLLEQFFVENGIKIGRDAFFAYLKREQMLVTPMKNYTKTTFSKHWLRKYPNLFKDIDVNRTEQVFVSDITYIKSNERTHYLSLVTDVFSRKIVGYHLSDDMSAQNVVKALKMAVKNRRTNLQLIHHSDRGLQYCSQIYQNELNKNNILTSMTDGYDCYQNALAERINGILKQEFLIYKCKSRDELNQLIKESVECYNNKRPHLSLNMKTPNFVYEKTSEVNFTGFN